MKLPWYIKSKRVTEKEDHLYMNIQIRKIWIYWLWIKMFIQMLGKVRITIKN
jgi:hypothetical protein